MAREKREWDIITAQHLQTIQSHARKDKRYEEKVKELDDTMERQAKELKAY